MQAGAASEISVEAEYQLKTSTTSTNTATNTTTTTIQRDYQAGKRRAEAIWYREDPTGSPDSYRAQSIPSPVRASSCAASSRSRRRHWLASHTSVW